MEGNRENKLLAALKKGDQSAFKEIFDELFPSLVRTAYRYLRTEEYSKDIAQDAFVELWKRRETLQINTGIAPYLRRAVVNKCLNHLKREKRIDFNAPEDMPESALSTTAEDQLVAKQLEQKIQNAIDQLPTRCRTIFLLCRYEGKSHKEIATELGISTKTIENQMTKALKQLRNALKPD